MILLVEDQPGSRYALARILRHRGYDVTEAADANEALALLEKSHFDLVVTDVQMPGQDGLVLVARIRVKWPGTPILMMSGHLSEKAGKIVAQGWAEFIHKPIEPSVLISTIQRLLPGLDVGRAKDKASVADRDKKIASKILLIEKDNASRTTIANFLRENGFQVDDALSALEGASILQNGAHFDLAIYDDNLADSDRITFAAALSSTHPAIPIIGMISFPSSADRVLFLGRTEFIRKPISLEHLLFLALSLVFRPCRRKIGMQTWHLCTDCKDWPDSNYEEMPTNPFGKLELCNECRLNHSQGKCL